MRLVRILMAAGNVKSSLEHVVRKVRSATEKYALANKVDLQKFQPCVVAVGKTKPPELLEEAYDCGQRHFGENYVQELVKKAQYFKGKGINDIKWHFIGNLQRNKSNNLCSVPNLYMVETLDSVKLADTLNLSWGKVSSEQKLKVLVQINTSNEDTKGGCKTDDAMDLVNHVREKCPNLEFAGFMSIGAPSHDYSMGPNPDFQRMLALRDDLCDQLQLSKDDVELSMGMSADFEEAISVGSTIVRIGSTIFGARYYGKASDLHCKTEPCEDSSEASTVAHDVSSGITTENCSESEVLKQLKISK